MYLYDFLPKTISMSVALKGVERLNVSWFTGTKESWENCCRGASYNHLANFLNIGPQKRQSVMVTLFIII